MSDLAQTLGDQPQSVVVMIKLQGWKEAEELPEHLSTWYHCVTENVSHYLKAIFRKPFVLSEVAVQANGTRERFRTISEILKKIDDKAMIWNSTGKTDQVFARQFRNRIVRKAESVVYVLVTDDYLWDVNAFWMDLAREPCVEEGHVLQYGYIPHHDRLKQAVPKSLASTYQEDPTICRYFPGPSPLLQEEAATLLFPPRLPTATKKQQEEGGEDKGSIISTKSDLPDEQDTLTEVSCDSHLAPVENDHADEEDAKAEASCHCTCLNPVEKVAANKKGDDFLSFLERALSIYEKV